MHVSRGAVDGAKAAGLTEEGGLDMVFVSRQIRIFRLRSGSQSTQCICRG